MARYANVSHYIELPGLDLTVNRWTTLGFQIRRVPGLPKAELVIFIQESREVVIQFPSVPIAREARDRVVEFIEKHRPELLRKKSKGKPVSKKKSQKKTVPKKSSRKKSTPKKATKRKK